MQEKNIVVVLAAGVQSVALTSQVSVGHGSTPGLKSGAVVALVALPVHRRALLPAHQVPQARPVPHRALPAHPVPLEATVFLSSVKLKITST